MKQWKKYFLCFLFVSLFSVNFVQANTLEESVELRSEYAIVVNVNENRILYEKKANEKMYPASMTKIMTALVAIEKIDNLQEMVTIEEVMLAGLSEMSASVAGLRLNEKVTYEDLLYGTLLPSGADATNALSIHLFGSEDKMVEAMNQKAHSLHMQQTHFMNASGLHEDEHYSTAYDMSLLLKEALQNKTLKSILSTPTYKMSNGRTLISTIQRQATKDGLDIAMIAGGKTGFTNEASLCLASFKQDKEELYIMVSGQTNSSNARAYHLEDALRMYAYIQSNYQKETLIKKGDVIGQIDVRYAQKDIYDVVANQDIALLLNTKAKDVDIIFDANEMEARVFPQSIVGTLRIQIEDEVVYEEDIMMLEGIKQNKFAYYLRHMDVFFMEYAYVMMVVAILCGSFLFYYVRKKQRVK